MAGRIKLSLGELRSATCGFEAVFLSLLHSGVTGQEAGFFQDGAVVLILLQQSSGKTVTDGTSLAGNAAACNGADDIKAASGFNQLQGLADDELQSLQAKVIVNIAAIDGDRAGAGVNTDTGNGILSSTSS